nr:hypothetical protein B0A51_14533 [Rachicladosporium sp. CCFEE 5018]OQO25552.1 hypothetical protein B0A51_06871 [Rachicladosporium sp. CCFEE 5018]
MVNLEAVRASNAQGELIRDFVGVYVGATGGIGEATLKEVFQRTVRPRAYIIGRSKDKADEIISKLSEINPSGQCFFIARDVSRLENVDTVCAELREKEPKINALFLTAGYMTLSGRTETDEGLDRKMCTNYYSRIRFTLNLMPCLTAAAEAGELSRVNTILAAGSEGKVNVQDLDLKKNFGLHTALAHCTVMSDFMVEELAKRYPGTTFMHSYPGTVKTGIANELTGPARLAVKVMYSVMSPWILNVQESGERHFYQLTSQSFPPAEWRENPSTKLRPGVPAQKEFGIMKGSDGTEGSGAYLLDWNSKSTGDEKVLKRYRDENLGPVVWEHTMKMFAQAEELRGKGKGKGKRSAEDDAEGSGKRTPGVDPLGWRPG